MRLILKWLRVWSLFALDFLDLPPRSPCVLGFWTVGCWSDLAYVSNDKVDFFADFLPGNFLHPHLHLHQKVHLQLRLHLQQQLQYCGSKREHYVASAKEKLEEEKTKDSL